MIWLVGNKGQLGKDIEKLISERQKPFVSSDTEVDIADGKVVKRFCAGREIEWIVNCAAYTAVDQAETEKDRAFSINALGAGNLAEAAKRSGAGLLHISTDYVFDGTKDGAYTEEDSPCPAGVYGKSKLEGETLIRERIDAHYIIRTSWLYGRTGKNFVLTMLRLFDERDEVDVVADQWGSPTWTVDLAGTILHLVDHGRGKYGTYHYSGEGKTTWHGFAEAIYERARDLGLIRKDVVINPIKTSQYRTETKRPENSYLSKQKIMKTFSIEIPNWRDSLDKFFSEMKER
jgi:dTDP-4-dehydrorhamnose reductase